jgi:Uma2 family endonuclease
LNLSRRATYADYLAAEQSSESRHELIDGVIVAMAGGAAVVPVVDCAAAA